MYLDVGAVGESHVFDVLVRGDTLVRRYPRQRLQPIVERERHTSRLLGQGGEGRVQELRGEIRITNYGL